ncbi:amino acid ABC transporter permease [bacterium]|nr:MAG: amino acid ABC transporter permease [bacterium]
MGYQWDWSVIPQNAGFFVAGIEMTLVLAVLTMLLSSIGGLLLAFARLSPWAPLRLVVVFYVETFRTTPFLIQLFWIFYGMPYVFGVSWPPFAAGLATLSLNLTAFNSEIFRAGIQSVAAGQKQAALALGMNRVQVMTRVVLPQAVRRIIPPLGSQWVSMFQATSLVSFIAVPDLMYQSLILRSDTYRSLEILSATALLYLILGYPQAKIVDYLYRRMRVNEL